MLSIEEDARHVEAESKRMTLARLKAIRAKLGELLPVLHLAAVKLESAINLRDDSDGDSFPAITGDAINFEALLAFGRDDRGGLEALVAAEVPALAEIVKRLDICSAGPATAEAERAKFFELTAEARQSAALLEAMTTRPR